MGLLTVIAFFLFISCATQHEKTDNSYYVEFDLSFYDPYDKSFTAGPWIRDPRNIKIAHESFKKFGYERLLSETDLFEAPCRIPGLDGWVENKSCKDIVDSLIIHYPNMETAPKYYREFWTRRKNEGNIDVVLQVLMELKAGVFGKNALEIRQEFVNDTIVNLLGIRYGRVNDKSAIKHFAYLKSIGLHMSAHNLLFERYNYYDVNWDRRELAKALLKDTTRCCPSAVFEDDTK